MPDKELTYFNRFMNLEVTPTPSFVDGVNMLIQEIHEDLNINNLILIDLDGCIATGPYATAIKYPLVLNAVVAEYFIPNEHMMALRKLYDVIGNRMIVVTNRTESDPVWRSERLYSNLYNQLELFGLHNISVITNADRLVPDVIRDYVFQKFVNPIRQNISEESMLGFIHKFIGNWDEDRWDELLFWIECRNDGRKIKINLLADRSIESLTEKFYILDLMKNIPYVSARIISIRKSLLSRLGFGKNK